MAKPQGSDAMKVGLVTIGVVAAVFVVLLWISRGVGGRMRDITIRFASSPDMPTLAPGSPVLVGGQKVGNVISTALRKAPALLSHGRSTDAFFLFVNAQVQDTLEIKADCKVVAEGPPLGGDGVLKIDLGTADEPIKPGTVILASEVVGFGAVVATLQQELDSSNPASLLGKIKTQLDPDAASSLMAKLSLSLGDLNAITGSLRKQFNEQDRATLLAKLGEIAENVTRLTGSLRRELESDNPRAALGKVHHALDGLNDGLATLTTVLRTNEPRLNRTMTAVEQAASNISAETDPARAGSLMSHFKLAGDKLNIALADVDRMTGTLRDAAVLNKENINRMLANFKEASDHLKTGVKYVLRHPWQILNEPKEGELRQQTLSDAARDFTDAAARIDDAASQLKALSEVHEGAIPADDPDLRRIRDELKQSQQMYRRAEDAFWKQLESR